MNNVVVISPNCTADSAQGLADLLRVPYICKDSFLEDSEPDMNSKVINWGCSRIPEGNILLNQPRSVRRSLNKLRTFELLSEHVRMPVMTLSKEEATSWARRQGRSVVIRNRIKGSKSQGVYISHDPSDVESMPAKFYTRYIANCTEVRVNVYKGKVLTVYYKKPSNGDFRFKIQSGAEENPPEEILGMVHQIGDKIGLDMYGIDVLLTPKGKFFLLEVNSAPILFPITMKRLAKAITREFQNESN